jgi:hypothetical protein
MGVCVLCRAGVASGGADGAAGVASGGAGDAAGVASGGANGGRTGVGAARLRRFAGPPFEFAFRFGRRAVVESTRAVVEVTRGIVESYRGVWYAMARVE